MSAPASSPQGSNKRKAEQGSNKRKAEQVSKKRKADEMQHEDDSKINIERDIADVLGKLSTLYRNLQKLVPLKKTMCDAQTQTPAYRIPWDSRLQHLALIFEEFQDEEGRIDAATITDVIPRLTARLVNDLCEGEARGVVRRVGKLQYKLVAPIDTTRIKQWMQQQRQQRQQQQQQQEQQ